MLPSDPYKQVCQDIFENAVQVQAALEPDNPNTNALNRLIERHQAAMTQLKNIGSPPAPEMLAKISDIQNQVVKTIKTIEAKRDRVAKNLSRISHRKKIIGIYGTQNRT